MLFLARDNGSTIQSVVESNSGLSADELVKEVRDTYIENLKEGVEFVKKYIKEHPNATIKIIGDYDTDGICATGIMVEAFRLYAKIEVQTRLPKRFSEGYGLSEKIIDEIEDDDCLIITVDNGIKAINPVKKAKERGMSVLIIDHHLPARLTIDGITKNILPDADVIIDPHIDTTSPFKDYCGAALAYRFARELMPDKKLKNLLVLASIATVADVMSLIGANRTIVKDGLELINKGFGTPGLKALLKELNLEEHITESNYGFKIGPTFNAPGRLYDNGASKVLALISARRNDPRISFRAKKLKDINEKRKEIVKENMLIVNEIPYGRPAVIYEPTIGEGIIGIIAGKICEKEHCPCIVFTDTEDSEIIKGSGRSIEEVHLANALDSIQDLIVKHGGHAGAAGLSIKKSNLDKFTKAFTEAVGELPPKSDVVRFDLDLGVSDNFDAVIEELNKYAPYGEGNPRPVFRMIVDLDTKSFQELGDGTHFSIWEDKHRIKILGFGFTAKYKELKPKRIQMIGYLSEQFYNDSRTICFEMKEFEQLK